MLKDLLKWSEEYNDLPWRKERTLYGTLVSEIMLQQTTVGTVLKHFDKFIKKYPNTKSLAKLSEEEMQIAWKGLGYYRRARNLLKAAKYIEEEYKGKIPLKYEELISIPGIGAYTANAIISIGANKRALPVDANIERVISRLYSLKDKKGLKLQKKIYELFDQKEILVGTRSYRKVAESLMDLGRVYCKSRKAMCITCPMNDGCKAQKSGKPLDYPVIEERAKKKESYELELLRVVVKNKNKVLAYKKSENEWLSSQYEIPTFIIKSEDKKLKQYPENKIEIELKSLKSFKTGITKYKIKNYILELSENEFKKKFKSKKYRFIDLKSDSNLSTASFKTLKRTEREFKPDSV